VSGRTGLAAEVPTLELCRKMAAIPALAEAFKGSTLVWFHNPKATFPIPGIAERGWLSVEILVCPAPTVREMLAILLTKATMERAKIGWWHKGDTVELTMPGTGPDGMLGCYPITEADAIARACIEAGK
jgi:hypothetical protein